MITVALTGHTRGLGAVINEILQKKGYLVQGFSLSNGYDLRDYDCVGKILDITKNFNWFINCAKPDYVQSQLLYRLISNGYNGKILSIGSPVVYCSPKWTDLGLLEYVTQKIALEHAHRTLSAMHPDKLFIWHPMHTQDVEHVITNIEKVGL
jgi:hypothetical protein